MPEQGLQILIRKFFDKMYILCFNLKYWKWRIPFFNQICEICNKRWSTKSFAWIKFTIFFSFLRYLEENQLVWLYNNLLESYRNVYKKSSAKRECYDKNVFLKGVSLSRTFEKSIFFFLFQSMELLSENIFTQIYSPYRNSFDGRVPSSGSA